MKNGRTEPNQVEAKYHNGEALSTEEKHRFVMDSINDAVYRINPHGFFTSLNDTALKLTGLTPETFWLCRYLDLVAPEGPGAVSERDLRGDLYDFNGPVFPVSDQDRHGQRPVSCRRHRIWVSYPHFIHILPILLFSVGFLNTFPEITALCPLSGQFATSATEDSRRPGIPPWARSPCVCSGDAVILIRSGSH